ncbi:ABC transporter substrate-binding protein [Nesterenkonia xinjiangensis]|uniref:Putative spermidine/putrescine transport system substrate-binding protein n=1 Tax=Nesterenkonia xinjiangensis TaxID=225327 RepID=A0A7Z0GLI7_9MICC|nr:ABC transporter substrate-binding protein [Nesterenkonia xinjiangensis]NYJ78195.1 putative spermidine/putrescine transport system substrate-binding protein [Nesterenkonia xinjiangensis]
MNTRTVNRKIYSIPALSALLLLAGCGGDGSAEGGGDGQLVVASWGGSGTEAQREHWYEPFTEETGIEIVEVTPPASAQLKAQVDSGNVEWDLALLEGAAIDALNADGDYLDPLPYEDFDQELLEGIPEEAQREEGVAAYYWGWTQVYRTDVFDDAPQNWEDFWDTENFPGSRTMPDYLRASSEAALMAHGTAPEDLYPIDIDSALDHIGELDGEIATYWDSGAEGVQLLADNEAVIGQVFATQAAPLIAEGVPLDIAWNGGLYAMDYFTVPSGQMSDEVVQFLEFISAPERQAAYANVTGAGPVHEDSFEHVDGEMEQYMITYPENFEQMVQYNHGDWWGEHRDEMEEVWAEWKLEQ